MAFRVESGAEPIPGYRLIERLGGGGFGEVWKAEAPGGLFKAIKFVYGDLQTVGEDACRAEQELKGLSRVKTVHHPYILSLERFDIIDGQLMIVMELADRTLWDRFKECRTQGLPGIPRLELLSYMEETAEALDLMNTEYQLQHLDIKPQNLFLNRNHIKVADFGLVKDMEGMTGATVTGGVTPVYAAPETFDGRISRFSDQYSLAIVYQELLTGTRPFTGSTMRQLVLQHLQGIPELAPMPAADRTVLQRALAKNPDERFPSCLEMVKALVAAQMAISRPPALPARDKAAEKNVPQDDMQVTREVRANKRERANPALTPVEELTPAEENATPPPAVKETSVPDGICQDAKIPENFPVAEPIPETTAPPEASPGILQPALVIGLGQLGIDTLRQLRKQLNMEFGNAEALPHLRLVAMDTDADALQSAGQGDVQAILRSSELLNTKLYRPSHYLKGRDGKCVYDGWLNSRMIYRIPRQHNQAGARSLGRLAFVDNYRSIYRRLESELQACCSEDTLHELSQHSDLGLRTRVPRIYLVTSLAGTTGGGMFLDVAYLIRQLLRRLGCGGEVVGLFYLPPSGTDPVRLRALANTYAALTELQHFSNGRAVFNACYLSVDANGGGSSKPFTEAGPPFQRCYLVNLPERKPGSLNSVRDATQSVGQASEYLFRDLATPLGKELDARRRSLGISTSSFYSLGLRRLVWPRRQLLEKAGRRLCGRLIERWLSKNATSLAGQIREWSLQQWEAQGFRVEDLISAHQEKCERQLKQAPEKMFAQIIDPLAGDLQASGGRKHAPVEQLNIGPAVQAMDQLEKILGVPDEFRGKGATPEPGVIERALAEAAARIADTCDKKLAELVVRHLIEEPRFRLAGAEEALRQFSGIAEKALQAHEQLVKELNERASAIYLRIHKIFESPAQQITHTGSIWKGAFSRRTPGEATTSPGGELLDLMRAYPKCRYQSLVLQHITRLYVSLRGLLSDQIREVGFCRQRLGELAGLVENIRKPVEEPRARPGPSAEKCLLPPGCTDLEDAQQKLEDRISADDLLRFDQNIQALIKEQFQALVHVCMGPSNVVKNLAPVMIQEAIGFLEPHLQGTNIAEMYLHQHDFKGEMTPELKEDLRAHYAEAAPKPAQNYEAQETSIVSVPGGDAGESLRNLLHAVVPGAYILTTDRSDEILFFREQGPLCMSHLEQLGTVAEEAYRQAMAADAAGLHTRADIPQWQALQEA